MLEEASRTFELKLDKSFVSNTTADTASSTIVRSTIDLARARHDVRRGGFACRYVTGMSGKGSIEEYARHVGHADLLREAVDGATGE